MRKGNHGGGPASDSLPMRFRIWTSPPCFARLLPETSVGGWWGRLCTSDAAGTSSVALKRLLSTTPPSRYRGDERQPNPDGAIIQRYGSRLTRLTSSP